MKNNVEKTINQSKGNFFKKIFAFDQSALLLAMVAIIIFFSIGSEYFMTAQNISNVFRQVSINLIAGIGMTILLLVGEVDLSIGSLTALVSLMCCMALNATKSVAIAVVVAIAVGVIVGLVNAAIVNGFGINSLITTLGMMSILRGSVYLANNAVAIQVKVPEFTIIGTGDVFGMPIPVVIAIALFIVFLIILTRTAFGRYVYACGDNADAAKASGINVKKVKMKCFVLCSVMAAVSGLILTARVNSAQPNLGVGFEFIVIAAAILGGTSLSGGQGSLFGTLIGVFILQFISNGMVLMNISSFYQEVVRGVVIILAVILDTTRMRRQELASSKLTQQLELEENSSAT